MTHRRALLAALALPVLLGAGACSEDETLSKEEFIEEGDDICQRADDRTGDLEEPEDLESITDYVEEAAPIFEDAGDDFEALQAPEDGEEVQDAFVGLVREGQDTLDQLRDYGFEQCGEDDG